MSTVIITTAAIRPASSGQLITGAGGAGAGAGGAGGAGATAGGAGGAGATAGGAGGAGATTVKLALKPFTITV